MPPARTHFCERGGARVGALFEAGEDVLELHHAGVGEQQRGVVARHQRGRGHDRGRCGAKKSRKLADVVDAAHFDPLVAPTCGSRSPLVRDRCAVRAVRCARGSKIQADRGLMFRGLFSGGGWGVSLRKEAESEQQPVIAGLAAIQSRSAVPIPRRDGRVKPGHDSTLKTPSPPSSVAAALRSRVPTEANADALPGTRYLIGAAKILAPPQRLTNSSFRSFPRTRESSSSLTRPWPWVPACAETNG